MADDPTNGSGGNGRHRGRGRDEHDDISVPEEPTVVVSSRRFLVEGIERISRSLRRAADRCDELGFVVDEAGVDVAIDDLDEEYEDLETLIGALRRSFARLKDANAKKETST